MATYQKAGKSVSLTPFLVFAVVILGTFIAVSYSTYMTITRLQSEQDSLQVKINIQQSTMSALQSAYNDLERDYQTLNTALNGMSNNYQTLQNLYYSLAL